jgi:hypothetical protein
MAARSRRHRIDRFADVWLGRRRDGASRAIYGTILATAVTVALSADVAVSAGALAAAVAGTAIIFWLTHAYANLMGERAGNHDPSSWRSPRTVLADEWPIVESALPPIVVLALGALNVLSRDVAVSAALIVAVAELMLWGYVAGRRMGLGIPGAVGAATVNGVFGGLIVALTALIH